MNLNDHITFSQVVHLELFEASPNVFSLLVYPERLKGHRILRCFPLCLARSLTGIEYVFEHGCNRVSSDHKPAFILF